MKLNLEPDFELEPITDRIALPVNKSRKERYYKVAQKLSQKKKRRLHSLARERIDKLLDEVESVIGPT